MRMIAVLFLAGLCCAPVWALSEAAARQLLSRSGFVSPPAEIAAVTPLSAAQAVDRIVDAAARQRVASTPAPGWVDEPLQQPFVPKGLSQKDQRALRQSWAQRYLELQTWWMQEMLTTPAPLAERMTLFWHGHFTSSLQTVKAGQLIYRQNTLLRAQALGNYRQLLHEIAHDPAMLLYLNNQQNRKGAPNENFARELLELFTLGEGHYEEQDIKEAARAFTGWKALPPEGRFVEVARQHDEGEKTFMGRRGNFDGDDIIDIILAQPQAARFIVESLWREFLSPEPDAAAVARLSEGFRKNWEIAPLIKALLREPQLFEAKTAGLLVKSPVEFVVGTVRALDLPLSALSAVVAVQGMGQRLFYPPNVRGWPGGNSWITSEWLLERRRFVHSLTGDAPLAAPKTPGGGGRHKLEFQKMRQQRGAVSRRFGEVAESLPVQGADRLLLALSPVQPPVEGAKPPDRLETWLLDPVYNLK